jgi:RHS repeat-associated protein
VKWLLLCLAFCSCLIAEEDFSDLEASKEKVLDQRENYFLTSTDYRITPKVNPITGEYCEEEADLIVAGSQPLSVRRFYSHFAPYDPRFASWRYNPESFFVANLEWGGQTIFAAVGEADGGICTYQRSNTRAYTFDFQTPKNFFSYSPDGKTHPLNTTVSYWRKGDRRDKHRFQYIGSITDGSGRERSFASPMHRWTYIVHYTQKKRGFAGSGSETKWIIKPNTWTPYHIPIYEEKLPNGNILCYAYKVWKEEKRNYPRPVLLSGIMAYNSTRTKILGYILLHYPRFKDEEVAGIQMTGSDSRQAFIQHVNIDPILLCSARRPDQPPVDYGFQSGTLNRVEKPDGRVLTTEYQPGTNKVSAQYAPVGPNGEMCPIGRYEYQDKATIIYDAENNKTVYRFDENKKILAIETFQCTTLFRTDRFSWDPQTGNLLRKTVEDTSGKPFQITEYQYDKNQNPILEKIGQDGYTITRTFSEDGFNLKRTESDRDGRTVCYNYLPGTNLLLSEFVYAADKICKRTFHAYDDCAVCIKTITDDGSSTDPNDCKGVTYRRITEIQPKQSMPCFGLPEVVQEKTIDPSGQEILLKKVVYSYTPFGKVLEEKHYDAEGNYRYTLRNTYDERERLIATVDPLGHSTSFSFDKNNNLTSITGPKPGQHKEITYDKANRPIRIADWQTDGSILVLEKRYDKLGQVTAEIDACGNVTRLEHDSLGRVTAVYHPDGAIERKEYDILGNAIKEIDAEGYATCTRYNFRGKPLFISHPDGKEEHFTYNTSGTLATHIDKNGSKSVYTYDIFDHPIRVEVYASSGELLKVHTSVYTPFCKLSETDGEGITTTYTYDFCGRKIAEQTALKKSLYFYDPLGRLTKTDVHYFQISEEHDNADQPIAKRIEADDLQFQEKYGYDEAGNRTQLITSHGAFETIYNTVGKALLEKDPLGFVTTHEYHFGKEHRATTTDANGIKTIHIYDSRGREAEVLKKNRRGEIISKHINRYNKNGNLIDTTYFIFDGASLLKTITHHWDYGPLGRIERFVEAGEKETRYLYDPKGRLATIVKPSGIQLQHEWDDLGRLARYFSSDFDYCYTYDRNDRLLSVYDSVSKKETSRSYNALGNITQEILANGLNVSNVYDDQGRRVALNLLDSSTINYTYRGAYLYSVSRNGLKCTYQTRDLEGHLIQADLSNQLGCISIERDALSRWKKFESPFYHSTFPKGAYDPVGNLLHYQYQDVSGTVDCIYKYDDLNQLVSENEHTYNFDSLHNRLKKDNLPHQVNTLCQIIDDGTTAYEYDRDGNLTFDGCWHYTYDTQDRLIALDNGNKRIEYAYDPFHRRLSKKVFSNNKPIKYERYLWDGDNEIGVVNERGSIEQLRVLGEGSGAEIGAAVLYELHGKSYVPLHDHRGCVVALVDPENGQSVENYRYTAFGEELTDTQLSPWRFSSKRIEEETGLVFFGRRYYFPAIGRWITQDPQGFDEGPNLYAYLQNSPLMQIDCYGLWGEAFGRYFNKFSHMAFGGVEWTGANLIPIPYVQNVVESIGRWGAGGDFFGASRYRTAANEVIPIPGRSVPGHSYTHGNGMMTKKEDAIKQAKYISQTHGDVQVDLLYNGTNGLMMDLIGCGLAKLGIPTQYNKMCASYYTTKIKADPEHRFTSSVHSRGGTRMMNTGSLLSPKQRKHIAVLPYGSSTLIPKDYFGSAENILSPIDLVSMTNPLAFGLGLIGKQYNIHFLAPSTYCPLKAHGFLEETYAEEIKRRGNEFKKVYFNE